MNAERVVSLVVVLVVVVAMGISATTLESSLSSDSDEVIDLGYENIPLGQEAVRDAKDEVERNTGDPSSSGEPRTVPEQRPSKAQSGGGASDDGSGEERALLDRLLDLLMQLLPFLLALLALLACVALARRYGERLLALLLALVPRDGEGPSADDTAWLPVPRSWTKTRLKIVSRLWAAR